jgi:PKD repeat protein
MMKQTLISLALLSILVMAFLVVPVTALGLTIDNGEKITAIDGATSPWITINDPVIAQDGTITINVSSLNAYVASDTLTNDNVQVLSDDGAWSGIVANDTLTLTLTGRPSVVDEFIIVTFTGAAGNPWSSHTGGDKIVSLTANRTDGYGEATFNFMIQIGGLTVVNGEKITATDGTSSPVINITDVNIDPDDTITIDVSNLNQFVANKTFTTDNVIINDTAAAANWTGTVADNILTLTSTDGPTAKNETVTVTFTGAINPWIANTNGVKIIPLTATRTDGIGVGYIELLIEIVPVDLITTNGAKITTKNGVTSPVITINGSNIIQNDILTIDIYNLNKYVAGGNLTDANVIINDTAAAANWTGTIADNILTLTSTDGPTHIKENVTVTFTGAVNPWIATTNGEKTESLTATRHDGGGAGTFNFTIETALPTGLIVADGVNITETTGATSPLVTVAGSEIAQNGTITIEVSSLNAYVVGGTITDANVVVNDTATAANWTGTIADSNLTLTSTDGPTAINETVTVTFTGEANPWILNTHGIKKIPLTATRTDGYGPGTFNFVIEITPPPGFVVAANFSASKTVDIAPVVITFTDTSLGNPTSWSWDFGDGTWFNTTVAANRNPVHTYTNVGTYTVNLTATNAYGSDTKTQGNYINVLNGAIRETNTTIEGLIIDNCGGPQTITVDTSILPAALIPNNSVLEIQPPADRGLKNITIYALNGVGFSQNGNLITGNPTGVHLVTEEIAPTPGFSNEIGTNASFNYSIDLVSYPCNAILSTKIWEGVISEYDNKFRWIAANNSAFPVGTAYTANIAKTNFPSGARAKIHMSVNSNWNPSIFGDYVFIWHIADDGNSGQILPTTYLYTDPVKNLDYFEADSPLGLSTFGISSLTGNNNPFQIVAFVAAAVVSPPGNPGPAAMGGTGGGTGGGGTSAAVQTAVAQGATPDPGKTTKIYTNAEGTITQATMLPSTDGLANIFLGLGIVARNSSGMPLPSISIRRIPAEELPTAPSGENLSFAGMAYELQPDGATFSPSIALSFTIPQEQGGKEYVIQENDDATGTWQALPGSFNPETGIITVQISHLCRFALFAQATETNVPENKPVKIAALTKPAMSTNLGMVGWGLSTIRENPWIIVIIAGVIALVAYFGWWKKRL